MLDVYVDADACPVKDEVYRVARRYDLEVFVVFQTRVRVPEGSRAKPVRVKPDFGAVDDWIAERIGPDDIVVTSDIPLADRCIKKGARALAPNGRVWTEATIGDALAARDLAEYLRQMGENTRGPASFSAADRSRFLSRLDEVVTSVRRSKPPPT